MKLKLELELSLIKNKTQKAVINIVNIAFFLNLTFCMLVNIHFQKRPKVATVCVLLILINPRWLKFFWRMVLLKVGFPLFQ